MDQGSAASAGTVASVLRRHGPLLVAALALIAALVALVVVLHNRDDTDKKAAMGEPLAYVPAGIDDVVFDLDTREPLVALAVEELAPRLTNGAVTSEQVHPLLGGRAVVATHAGKAWLVFATDQPAPRPSRGAAAAAQRRRRRHRAEPRRARRPRCTARASRRRSTRARPSTSASRGMPAGAGARVAFDPRPLLAQRAPQIANTAWARSLQRRRRRADDERQRAAPAVSDHRRPGRPQARRPADRHRCGAAERPRQGAADRRRARPGAYARASCARPACCPRSMCSTSCPASCARTSTTSGPTAR